MEDLCGIEVEMNREEVVGIMVGKGEGRLVVVGEVERVLDVGVRIGWMGIER